MNQETRLLVRSVLLDARQSTGGYREYEALKARLRSLMLTAEEYQQAIRELSRLLDV